MTMIFILHGAMMGVLVAGLGQIMGRYGGSLRTGARLAIVSVVGGTVAELGGGKFANGALTAAFAFLFNEQKHKWFKKIRYDKIRPGIISGEAAGDYRVIYNANIQCDGDNYTFELLGSASCKNIPGDATASITYSLECDDVIKYQVTLRQSDSFLTNQNWGELIFSGNFKSGVLNLKQYKNVYLHARTSWIVSNYLWNTVPCEMIPIIYPLFPLTFETKYKIK